MTEAKKLAEEHWNDLSGAAVLVMAESTRRHINYCSELQIGIQNAFLAGFEAGQASRWVKVEDALPTAYASVLFTKGGDNDMFVGWRVPDGNWTDPEENGLTYEQIMKFYTHWMPLPEPPQEPKREE